jgi:hypothetical protein
MYDNLHKKIQKEKKRNIFHLDSLLSNWEVIPNYVKYV